MKTLILAGVVALLFSFACGFFAIPLLRKFKAGQPILKYVKTHKEKNGTPTMGGLFFILPSVITCIIFGGLGKMTLVVITVGLSFMAVGLIDDCIKIKYKTNEGLKAYQKIIFQTSIAILAGFYAFYNGITVFHLPFFTKSIDLGWCAIPIIAFVFVAITNSVNLTDGLDGLAGNVSAAFLVCMVVLIAVQTNGLSHLYLQIDEYEKLNLLSVALIGGIYGFLIFNTSKAKVFMGDTGSLSLGGFLGAISIFSSNSLFIPIIGIMFVLSGISVIMQVLYYKRKKSRIFLMAPLHHHFQLKGYTESQITYVYTIVTFVCGLLAVLPYF